MRYQFTHPTERHNFFITGASSGIGRGFAFEISRRFVRARSKCGIVVTARRIEVLNKLVQEIQALPQAKDYVHIIALPLDVTDTEAIDRTLEQAKDQLGGPLHTIIVNAGYAPQTKWLGSANTPAILKDLKQCMEVNFVGAVMTTHLAIYHFKKYNVGSSVFGAHVVGISSIGAFAEIPGNAVYGATKLGFLNVYQTLQAEFSWHRPGFFATAICPGYVHTEMTGWVKEGGADLGPELSVEEACRRWMDLIQQKRKGYYFGWWAWWLMAKIIPWLPQSIARSQVKQLMSKAGKWEHADNGTIIQ